MADQGGHMSVGWEHFVFLFIVGYLSAMVWDRVWRWWRRDSLVKLWWKR